MSYKQTAAISPCRGLAQKAYLPGGWPAAFPHAPWSLQAAGPRVLAGKVVKVGADTPPAGRLYFDSDPSMPPPGLRGLGGDPISDLFGGAVGTSIDQAVVRVIDLSWARLEPRVTEKMMPLVAIAGVAAAASVVAAIFSFKTYSEK